MSTDEKTSAPPPYIVMTSSTSTLPDAQQRTTGGRFQKNKKRICVAVTAVSVTTLVLTAILIGVGLFMQEQQNILEFELSFLSGLNQNVSQKVQSDPNANVVIYHVTKPGQDVYIVDDFNRGIQTVRIELTDGETNCYVTPLNISAAVNPSQISGPESMSGSSGASGPTYVLSGPPVTDTSFLTPKAATLCSGVSVYWITPDCGSGGQQINNNGTTPAPSGGGRKKRTLYYEGTLNVRGYTPVPCLGGCCNVFCACAVTIVEYITGNVHTCYYYVTTGTCGNPYYYYYTYPMAGLICPAYTGVVYYGQGR